MDIAPPPIDHVSHSARALSQVAKTAAQAKAGGAARDPAAIRAAAEEFEAIFLGQMLAPMFETIETDGPFGGGSGERIYRSMLVEHYGRSLARAGGVGIADTIEKQLLALQESQP